MEMEGGEGTEPMEIEDDEASKEGGDGGAGGTSSNGGVDEEKDGDTGPASHHQLNVLLNEELSLCYNREKADDFSIRFCSYNTKSARKRLVQAVFTAPRQSLDLLPHFGRIIATLNRFMTDLGPMLQAELQVREGDMSYHGNNH